LGSPQHGGAGKAKSKKKKYFGVPTARGGRKGEKQGKKIFWGPHRTGGPARRKVRKKNILGSPQDGGTGKAKCKEKKYFGVPTARGGPERRKVRKKNILGSPQDGGTGKTKSKEKNILGSPQDGGTGKAKSKEKNILGSPQHGGTGKAKSKGEKKEKAENVLDKMAADRTCLQHYKLFSIYRERPQYMQHNRAPGALSDGRAPLISTCPPPTGSMIYKKSSKADTTDCALCAVLYIADTRRRSADPLSKS